MKPTRRRRLTLFALVCVIYFTVSGGAFGVEPLVGAVAAEAAGTLAINSVQTAQDDSGGGIGHICCSFFLAGSDEHTFGIGAWQPADRLHRGT